jgi:hypothetical protein
MLSPLTFWNDAFINIPLSYVLANVFVHFFPKNFVYTTVIFYWLTNLAGLFMMYLSGKYIVKSGKDIRREIEILILTTLVYSTILVLLGKFGILKPVLFSANG